MTMAEELRAEGRVETLLRQIQLKFGGLPTQYARRLQQATEQQLDRYIERILTASTPDELFAD